MESLELRPRHRQILRLLWPAASLSRREVQRKLDVHPNLIGADIGYLLKQRLVSEGESTIKGRGRPGIPLRVDPQSRHVIGLAISPDGVELSKVNLLGEAVGENLKLALADPKTLIRRTAKQLAVAITPDTLMVGVATTGLVDPVARTLLLSSSIPDARTSSLAPLFDAAGETPMIVQNDLHALAARWLLNDGAAAKEDVLIVLLEDGRIGAAMLLRGAPNQGCAIGANELGHMRFPVETAQCYCGQEGCLERIFSSEQLHRLDKRSRKTLAEDVFAAAGHSPASPEIVRLLCHGVANACNFVRPHRLVVIGSFTQNDRFFNQLSGGVKPLLLSAISDRLKIERWSLPTRSWGEIAAWVALASLLGVDA